MSTQIAIVVVIAVAVILIIAGAIALSTRRRSERLRDTFGPEYDRTVEAQGGDRDRAERELMGRMDRRKKLDIVALDEAGRTRYAADLRDIEARFVGNPADALRQADRLVNQVMDARGYPAGDFETRLGDLSVHHSGLVDGYRSAHAVCEARAGGNPATTEEMRRAMQQYSALCDALLKPATERKREYAAASTQATARPTSPSSPPAAAPPPPPAAPPPARRDQPDQR